MTHHFVARLREKAAQIPGTSLLLEKPDIPDISVLTN
jgi:hypothetical protein